MSYYKEDANGVPLVLTCPVGGEDWPASSYMSYIDTHPIKKGRRLQFRHVHFCCPAPHDFTLSRAKRTKMFTAEQVARIFAAAEAHAKANVQLS